MVAPSKRDFVIRTQLDAANSTNQASMSPSTFVLGVNNINTTAMKVGANVVLSTASLTVGNSTSNATIFSSAITLSNTTSNTSLRIPTVAEASGNNFLHANGSWVNPALAPSVPSAVKLYQKFTAVPSQTTFTMAGGFDDVDVYYNGAHLANDEYTATSPNVILVNPAIGGATVELVGWEGTTIVLTAGGSDTQIQYNEGGLTGASGNLKWEYLISKFTVGNTTANVSANSTLLQMANSTATINVTSFGIDGGSATANVVANTTLIRVATATGIANITPQSIFVGNSTANVNVTLVGGLSVANSTASANLTMTNIQVTNSTGTGNITPQSLNLGNTTANAFLTVATGMRVANSIANASLTLTGGMVVANATHSITANLTNISLANSSGSANTNPTGITVGTPTAYVTIGLNGINQVGSNNLNLGTGSFLKSANGYTFLPNGLILQWGVVAANASGAAGNLTFPVVFPTAVYSYNATSTTANAAYIITANTSTMNVRITAGGGPQGVDCHWMAIGS